MTTPTESTALKKELDELLEHKAEISMRIIDLQQQEADLIAQQSGLASRITEIIAELHNEYRL